MVYKDVLTEDVKSIDGLVFGLTVLNVLGEAIELGFGWACTGHEFV